MELKFIWIDKYRIIENLGVNFNHSGKHGFEYLDGNLKVHPNLETELIFGPNIKGITAIAGENGSGKSSLCEIVLLSTATHVNGAFGFNYLFKGIVCYGDHIFIHDSLDIKNIEELVAASYVLERFKESPFEKMKFEWLNTFVRGGFIYYSNFLDYRNNLEEFNLKNASTLACFNTSTHYSTYYPKASIFNRDNNLYTSKDSAAPTHLYYSVEANKLVKFYINFPELVPFIKPEDIIVQGTYSGNNKWLDYNKLNSDGGFSEEIKNFVSVEREILRSIFDDTEEYSEETVIHIDVQKFKATAKCLYRFNLILILAIKNKLHLSFDAIYEFVFSSKTLSDWSENERITTLLTIHNSIVENSSLPERTNFKPNLFREYFSTSPDWRFYLIQNFYLPNSTKNRKLLSQLINLEQRVLNSENTIFRITNYDLPGLSSGENSFLTFFARLYDTIDKFRSSYDDKNNIILFLDEAEVGFHPAWKRIYFKTMLDFLAQYVENFTFQIILTTHSPYLLSDLPSKNVVLLKKDANGKPTQLDSRIFKTFGSNIHELLGTSFFLNDSFMGEFAKTKIEDLVAFLNNKNEHYNKTSAQKLISLIGDEIITSRLMDMFNEKYQERIPTNDKEYEEWLSAELKRIQLK